MNSSYDAVCVVRSPFQLMCAYEAVKHFDIKNPLLVVIFVRMSLKNNNNQQMVDLIEKLDWKGVYFVNEKLKKSKYFEYVRLLSRIRLQDFKYVFMGDYGNIQRVVAANTPSAEVYLIDDGIATYAYHKVLCGGDSEERPFSQRIKGLRFRVLGFHSVIRSKINFFTCLKLKQISDEGIIMHSFQHVREKFYEVPHQESLKYDMYFLGSAVCEVNLMTWENYHLAVKEYFDLHEEKKICYMMHRAENKDLLEAEFKDMKNINIAQNKMPIELLFLMSGIYPVRIATTISSAIVTLKKIFPNTYAEAIILKNEQISCGEKETKQDFDRQKIKLLYKEFKEDDINIIS